MASESVQNIEYKIIDPSEYQETLKSNPLWYTTDRFARIVDLFDPEGAIEETEEVKREKQEILRMFAKTLAAGEAALGNREEYFNDDDRWNPVDTVVIHHTSTDPDITLDELNALGLLRLYVPVYRKKVLNVPGDDQYQPISSGHFYNGKQVFFGYHHLVRSDGSSIQILKDDYTGFHADHYPTNCRSIGIAIVGDLSDKEPSDEAIHRVAQITTHYEPLYILGHGEVLNVKTECPGNTFYGEGWKKKLLTEVALRNNNKKP